jgi:CheY-like chemotaxis protein
MAVFSTLQSDMTPAQGRAAGLPASLPRKLHEVVIVDADCSRYGEMIAAAQEGLVGVHFCIDGRTAVRLARQFRADAWVIASQLPDMSGVDLVELLSRHVQQANVDLLRAGSRISLAHLGHGPRPAMFLIGDTDRPDDELRALAQGVSGYLAHPFGLETLLSARSWST